MLQTALPFPSSQTPFPPLQTPSPHLQTNSQTNRPTQPKEKKREKIDFVYFDFHIVYVKKLLSSFVRNIGIKLTESEINEIARCIVVDIYHEYQRKYIQKSIFEKCFRRHAYRYLSKYFYETYLS